MSLLEDNVDSFGGPRRARIPDWADDTFVSDVDASGFRLKNLQGQFHVKDYEAEGDGVTDDSDAIEAAAEAANAYGGGTVVFDQGTFMLSSKVDCSAFSNVSFRGAGRGLTILKSSIPVAAPAFGDATLLYMVSSDHISISGITFDNNNVVTTATDTCMVALVSCDDIVVEDCEFLNQKRHGLALNSCQRFWIRDNYFLASGGNAHLHTGIFLIEGPGTIGPGWVTNNEVVGTAVGGDGIDVVFDGNRITGSTSGAGLFTTAENALRTKILNNTISDGTGTDSLGFYINGIECYSPHAVISGNICKNNSGSGIFIGAHYSIVSENQCYDNGHAGNPTAAGIANNYQTATLTGNGSYSVISNNICKQIDGTFQAYGYKDAGAVGTTSGIRFSGNDFTGNGTSPLLLVSTSIDYTWNGSTIPALGDITALNGSYRKKQTLTVAANAFATLTVPAGYHTIRLSIMARGTNAATEDRVAIKFNGDTGNNYNWTEIGDITDSASAAGFGIIGEIAAATATAGKAGYIEVTIPNYAGTTFFKGYTAISNRWSDTIPDVSTAAGTWANAGAITSIIVNSYTTSFAIGSSIEMTLT